MRPLPVPMTVSLAGLLLAGNAVAQSGPDLPIRVVPPAEVVLRQGESAALGAPGSPEALVVSFRRVTSDSRCPRNVQCVWAGEVTVLLTLSGGATGELTLRLPGSGDVPSAAPVGRYRITLLGVTPAPVHGEPQREPTRVRLLIAAIP